MGEKSWAEAIADGAVGEVLVAGPLERGDFTTIGYDDARERGKKAESEESF